MQNKISKKKYNNRKLYNENESKYITLVEIGHLVKNGEIIEVSDANGNDITNKTLISVYRALEDDLACVLHYTYDSIIDRINKL
jgi:polyhydroxyalkanoate synthesis regulator protein